MDSLLLYTIKLISLSGIFVGYYWLALRNKRFHYFNRFYLLAALILSLIIPILRFDWVTNEKPVFMGSGETIDLIVGSTYPVSNNIGIGDISILLMIITSILMISISGYHIYKVYLIKKQSQITPMEGFDLMYTDEESAPFSFLDNLFWKRTISIEDEGGKQIFKHELTHIQQKHTWDRLFTQLCCSIFWMNPFCWIIQKELETIHEFIADEEAVGNQDVESFAKMLIQTHYGNHFFETKHSFFYSSIKRRLTMLTTTTNTRFSYLRRVMLLPLLLIIISIFSVRVHAKEKIEKKITALSKSIFQGKVVEKDELANTIAPIYITSVKKITKAEASKKYGDKGKEGVIEIPEANEDAILKSTDSSNVINVHESRINVSNASLNSENEIASNPKPLHVLNVRTISLTSKYRSLFRSDITSKNVLRDANVNTKNSVEEKNGANESTSKQIANTDSTLQLMPHPALVEIKPKVTNSAAKYPLRN